MLDILHSTVQTLDKSRFQIRPHLQQVDDFSDRARWEHLSEQDIQVISEHLAILAAPEGKDEMARRFDLLMLNLQWALINQSTQQKSLINNLNQIARKLTRKTSVPAVAKQLPTLKALQTATFWQNVNLMMLDEVRFKLRDLVKFLDKEDQEPVYTNFRDEIRASEVKEHEVTRQYVHMEAYKLRIERFIRQNEHHLTISKLKTNQPITTVELNELERLLFEGDLGSKDDFQREYGTDQPLGLFIRKILGLDKNAAKEAFSEFLSKGQLRGDQITFINNIIDFLSVNGTIDQSMLFEPPFTDLHHDGLLGVFKEEDATKLVSILDRINGNAGIGRG